MIRYAKVFIARLFNKIDLSLESFYAAIGVQLKEISLIELRTNNPELSKVSINSCCWFRTS